MRHFAISETYIVDINKARQLNLQTSVFKAYNKESVNKI